MIFFLTYSQSLVYTLSDRIRTCELDHHINPIATLDHLQFNIVEVLILYYIAIDEQLTNHLPILFSF
jgi:hypothetical protein